MSQSRVLGSLLLVLVVAGCSSSQPTGRSDAGLPSAQFVGRACTEDLECGNLRCDKVRRQCICLSDESCRSDDPTQPARYCNNYTGMCVTEVAGCTSDAQCQSTEYCDSSVRACRALKGFCEPCTSSAECGGAGDDCALRDGNARTYCSKACETHADCPRGAECVEFQGKKQCTPAADGGTGGGSCKNFRGCTPDSLRTCSSNAECSELGEQRCDPGSGRCVAVDRVCPFGTVCDPRNRICVAECSQDVDCGDPKLRCVDRVCEPLGECQTDDQCPLSKVCSVAPGQPQGQCVAFCQKDGDCPLGARCQKGMDDRYRCVEGCASHQDCAVNQRCNGSTKRCEGPDLGGGLRSCQATAACNTCELCDGARAECMPAKDTFPYCKPCGSQPECPGGACVQMNGGLSYCAKTCGSGQECPQGFVCLSLSGGAASACVPADRQCTNKCP